MTTVLVTDISSYKAVVVARFLKQAYPGIVIVGTDHRAVTLKFRTRWVDFVELLPPPDKSPTRYVEALVKVARKFSVDQLIPVNSVEVRGLMEHRHCFGTLLDYVGGTELYRQLDNKRSFAELVSDHGLPQPRLWPDLNAPLPLVVKPMIGSSSNGVRYVFTEAERQAAIAELDTAPQDCVIQEYVVGDGVGYSGFFCAGKPVVCYAHRRVAEYPATGGSSVVREGYPYSDLSELEALVVRLLAVAPWSGFAMFEFKRRGPGDFVFIECNPRVWGSIHQGLACGVNFFEPLLGFAPRPLPIRTVRTRLSPLHLLALAGYARSGRWDVVSDVLRSFPGTKADIHPLLDVGGYIALLARGA